MAMINAGRDLDSNTAAVDDIGLGAWQSPLRLTVLINRYRRGVRRVTASVHSGGAAEDRMGCDRWLSGAGGAAKLPFWAL